MSALRDGLRSHVRSLAPRWRLHHELPNRMRFRIAGPHSRRVIAPTVERAVEAIAGVHSARFCYETGSLLVHHDGTETTRVELRRTLELVRFDDAPAAHLRQLRPREAARNDAVRAALLSLVHAALPPGARAALQLVQSLSTRRSP